jgi:zinc/manganese transport system substrate-binding protein
MLCAMNDLTPDHRMHRPGRRLASAVAVLTAVALALGAAGCSKSGSPQTDARSGVISAVGAENEYASVLSQVGGRYVRVSAIVDNPNTDPHTFEASPQVAQEVSAAQLIVQNGVGYDGWISRIESASSGAGRRVIVVQHLLGLPDSTPNPHLWYSPKTMPAVAKAIAADLSALLPARKAYFAARLRRFDASLRPWLTAIAAFRAKYHDVTAATTEPVADYLLTAMGIRNLTPFGFQADIMNGVDPAPEDIALEDGLLRGHKVSLFAYNEQVTDTLTASVRQTALGAGVPVVGVYETMPTGYDYQSWMLAETRAIEKAVTRRISTQRLP